MRARARATRKTKSLPLQHYVEVGLAEAWGAACRSKPGTMHSSTRTKFDLLGHWVGGTEHTGLDRKKVARDGPQIARVDKTRRAREPPQQATDEKTLVTGRRAKGSGQEARRTVGEAARRRRVSDGTIALGHDSRVVDLQKASCNQMGLACGSSGAIVARKALHDAPIRPCVSTMAGLTFAGLCLLRFLLSAVAALPTFPAASMQKREVTCTSMSSKSATPCFGEMDAQPRAVFRVNGPQGLRCQRKGQFVGRCCRLSTRCVWLEGGAHTCTR